MEGAEPLSSRSQQPRQGMLPVPWTAGGQDGPKWLHANVPIQPMPKAWALHVPVVPGSQSQILTLSPQQTRALPATRCSHASSLHPSASSHPREQSGMDKCQQQVPAMGLPLGPEPHHSSSPAGSTGDWEEARRFSAGMRLEERSFLLKTAASASLSLE